MPNYQKIVVAIDLSDECEKIIQQSLTLSNNEPGRLHLIHACEHPITGYGEITGKNHQVTELQIKQQVFPALKDLTEQHHIPTDNLHISFGRPADAVHEMAKELEADLIITGSHGKQGLKLLLGSTANSIIHGATCDVLTVRV